MQLQRDKVGYLLAYGIAPFFFEKELSDKCNKCEFLVVRFDESLNKVAQKQQMDINVRFWDEQEKQVCTRYLTSVFLGRTRASDLLQAFKDGLKSVEFKKILQISMDGPDINLKFLKDFKADLNTDPDDKKLLDLGSCGLHTLHCAFKSSMQETGWNIVPFLRTVYNLFKDSPARRALFTGVTTSSVFRKKFCAVRWLQNAEVAQRAIELIPMLMLFVEEIEKSISSRSYKIVSEAIADPLLSAKLEFFRGLASDVEPFLEKFQSDEPLVSFLYEEISAVLMTQISRIVKPCAMDEIKSLKDLKIPEKNILSAGEINISIATKHAISKVSKKMGKTKDSMILKFRESCRKALIKFISKMLEKSPIHLRLTKATSCLDPNVAENAKVRKIRMESLLTILLDHNWISSSVADRVMREFNSLCDQPNVVSALKNYSRKTRVDHFWMNLITKDNSCSNLSMVIKLVCTLSHGNANIERGFSVNAECIVENMREELLVARRIVYDTILSTGGINNLQVEKPLIHAARNSYSRFLEASKEKKKQQEGNYIKLQNKRQAEINVKELQRKKAKILEDAQRQADLLNEEIKILSQI
ncbi:hypothetical protein AVEN_125336-1 [Araneus ventricosus]|uniref:Uncharacterized protein n=1 Tax=Araneus ventricosus TaxID=182803 RepID=A0A4Y2IE45_ARAVE|nr:hypothetical protein AVEN_125336-1 [Araneus ventricosus]